MTVVAQKILRQDLPAKFGSGMGLTAKCSVRRLQMSKRRKGVFSPTVERNRPTLFHFGQESPVHLKEEPRKTGKGPGKGSKSDDQKLLCVERGKEREVELGEMAAEEEYGRCSPLFFKRQARKSCLFVTRSCRS